MLGCLAGSDLIFGGARNTSTTPNLGQCTFEYSGAAVLLSAGLWTPVIGSLLVTLLDLTGIVAGSRDPWICILLGTFGICLALLGPKAWSADARLFGWKRIDLRD